MTLDVTRMTTLLIATRNKHKVQEIQAILGSRFRCLTLDEFPGAPPVVEDANTFAGNATKKAVELARWVAGRDIEKKPDYVLADDSGLEVDVLKGAPGVHSARFAAASTTQGNSSDAANNEKLLKLLHPVPDEERTGRFRCVLALTPVPGKHGESASPVCDANEAELATEIFDGSCEGVIGRVLRGKEGFGYDPLFVPNGFQQSFGELGEEIKNRLSHRSKAVGKLKAWFGRK